MAILDGRSVKPSEIDPAKHRFIGTWRPPAVPEAFRTAETICPCGAELNHRTSGGCLLGDPPFRHWTRGCFDEPQYVTETVPCDV